METYIDKNPDPYRGGYVWSVCAHDEVLYEGWASTYEEAEAAAEAAIK